MPDIMYKNTPVGNIVPTHQNSRAFYMTLKVSSLAHFPGHVTRFLPIHQMFKWSNELSRKSAQQVRSCLVRK